MHQIFLIFEIETFLDAKPTPEDLIKVERLFVKCSCLDHWLDKKTLSLFTEYNN